jgi:amino acid transporter
LTTSSSKPKVFVREATGLVRELSTFDAVAINWSGETLATGLLTFFLYAYLFPGADLVLAMAVSVIGFIPLSLTYAMSLAAMPRSGGDYVFISRSLHPSLGFMLLLSVNVWFSFYSGAFANWIFTIGLSPTLSVIGSILNDPSISALSATLSEPLVATIGGGIAIILTGVIAIVSSKWTSRLIGIMIGIGILSVIAIGAVLFGSTNAQFHAAFNAYSSSYTNSTDYYSTILSNASNAGFTQPGFSWSDTVAMIPFGAYVFLYISEMQAAGGEIKRAQKNSYYASAITILGGGLVAIAVAAAFQNTITLKFANAVSYAYGNGAGYVLPVQPTYNFLASLLTQSIPELWLLNIGFVTTSIALLLMYYMFTPRYFLASAFDRIMPEKLASVSERFHSPHIAIIVAMIFALITLPIYSYYATILATLSAVLGELVFGYLIFGIATIIFPYAKHTKAIYQSSPINKSVGGVPVITILGILNSAFLAFLGYMMFINPLYGVNSTVSIIAVLLVAAAAPIWYFARKAQLKTKGIDLGKVFVEIPPE